MLIRRVSILALLFFASSLHAELQIEINQGLDNPTPIAVVTFGWQGLGAAPEEVEQNIETD